MSAEVIWLNETAQAGYEHENLKKFRTYLRSLNENELIFLAQDLALHLKSTSNQWQLTPSLAVISEMGERLRPEDSPIRLKIKVLEGNLHGHLSLCQ